MMATNTKIKFTYRDYKSLPQSETKRYELMDGELIMVPAPFPYHQKVSGNLEYILRQFIQSRNLGFVYHAPCDVVLSDRDVVQPDIFFISKGRSQIITRENIKGAPDLIIEILSLSTAEYDRTYKRTLYARSGVKEYWIVDPNEREIEVMTLGEKGFETVGVYKYKKGAQVKSPLLQGLVIDLSRVFQ